MISLLDCRTIQLFNPQGMFLSRLVLPRNEVLRESLDRAFGLAGRLSGVQRNNTLGGPRFFNIIATDLQFRFSENNVESRSETARPSAVSVVDIAGVGTEFLARGRKLGASKTSGVRGASNVSRYRLMQRFQRVMVAETVGRSAELPWSSYQGMKRSGPALVRMRREVRKQILMSVLAPWSPNSSDDFEEILDD